MKKSDLILTVVQVPVDYILLVIAALTAYQLRFHSLYRSYSPVILDIPLAEFLPLIFGTSAIMIAVYAFAQLYATDTRGSLMREVIRIFTATSIGLVGVVFLMFFERDLFASRFIILVSWLLSIIFVFLGRFIMRFMRHRLLKMGIGSAKVVVIGDTKQADVLTETLQTKFGLGYTVVTSIPTYDEARLKEIITKSAVDVLVLADPDASEKLRRSLIEFAQDMHVHAMYVPSILGTRIQNYEFTAIKGIPLVRVKRTRLEKWGYIYKRLFDIIVSLTLIVLLSPVLILVAISLFIEESECGPLYKNERVGKRGNHFFVYKFRTMYAKYCTGPGYDNSGDAEQYEEKLIKQKSQRKGPLYKVLDDPRRTPIGKLLERWSIDELPQLFNVLLGTMSLVGPRPHQPREVAKYKREHKQLFEVKPGITGMAQISGRSDLDFEEEAKLDIFYIENWSIWLDAVILLKTPWVVVRGHKTK